MFEWNGKQLATYPEIAQAVAAISTFKEAQGFTAAYNEYVISIKDGYGRQAEQNIAFASTYLPPEAQTRVRLLFGIGAVPKIYVPKERRGNG